MFSCSEIVLAFLKFVQILWLRCNDFNSDICKKKIITISLFCMAIGSSSFPYN